MHWRIRFSPRGRQRLPARAGPRVCLCIRVCVAPEPDVVSELLLLGSVELIHPPAPAVDRKRGRVGDARRPRPHVLHLRYGVLQLRKLLAGGRRER